MDKRIIKTRSKIKSALIALLENADLADITVSRLCERAGINRSTFYVYYSNVSDCFSEISDEIIEEMRSALYSEAVRDSEAYLRVYFRTARRHQTVFRAIHTTGVHNPMIHKMVEINNEVIHNQLFIPRNNENLEYSFIFSGFYGMVEAWLGNGCKETEEELLAIMRKFYPNAW